MLTWYGNEGLYVDAQAKATWYNSDLKSKLLGASLASSNNGMGYALSIEAGQRYVISEAWALIPQAQLTYSSVDFDDFSDVFGTNVQLNRGYSIEARIGVSAEYSSSWKDNDGLTSTSRYYVVGNLYNEFRDETRVQVADILVTNRGGDLSTGLGLGGSYSWEDGKYILYGEGGVKTSVSDFGDRTAYHGKLGLRVTW
jgi:outer membrane autotransporter protein